MFVSFVDGDLKVVKYFRSPKSDTYDDTDGLPDPGECMVAGSWTITERHGSRGFPPMMYTNDFDDRRVLQDYVRVTQIDSKDLGYDPPKFSDFLDSPEAAYVWRERVFRNTNTTDTRAGDTLVSAVAIPQYSREAYYYAVGNRYSQGRSISKAISYDIIKDPNVGYAWRCFPRINRPPFPPDRPDCNTKVCRGDAPCTFGGNGFPKERRVVCTVHEPSGACSDFADSGQWLGICQSVDGFNQPGMDKTSSSTVQNLGYDESGRLFLVSPGHGGPLSLPVTGKQVFNHWIIPSPDPDTANNVHFIRAEHSAIGDDALVCGVGLSTYSEETRTYGYVPDTIGPKDGYPAFVGVNKP
jgi:hypothetical protein